MKVILLENVPKVGNKYEVATVADGYAMNFLIPKKKAEFASPEAVARIEKMQDQIAAERAAHEAALVEKVAAAGEVTISFALAANDEGTLFAALQPEEMLEALNGELGAECTLGHTTFTQVKEVGETEFAVTVGETTAPVKVVVTSEEK